MKRTTLALALLIAASASAHFFYFDFVVPSGIGVRANDGQAALQWVDDADPQDLADVTFFASRTGLAPFLGAPRDTQVNLVPVAVSDRANVMAWDTRGVPPGCYQPFAVMDDRVDGISIRRSFGLVTIGPVDGGNQPPAVWILNQETEMPAANGTFAVRLRITDPDDVGALTLRWSDGADAGGIIVQGLPTPDGGGTVTYGLSLSQLPPATAYYLQAEVKGFDGQVCATWWSGHLNGPLLLDGGVDAGVEGRDAGAADAGESMPQTPRGCGCAQSPAASMLAALALVGFARRRATTAERRSAPS